MSNFLSISPLPTSFGKNVASVAAPNTSTAVSAVKQQWSNFVNSNSMGEFVEQMPPWIKKYMIVSTALLIIVLWFIYQIYRYFMKRWLIRDQLYYYENFPLENNRMMKLYYGSPLKMERASIPGGDPGSFWFRRDSKIRLVNGNNISSRDGATIRMWLRLSSENFTENVSEDVPRVIFSQGFSGASGTTEEIINNPVRLLTNRTWMDSCQLGLFLNRRLNQLVLRVGRRGAQSSPSFEAKVEDVPIHRWFHLTLRVTTGVVEAYVDGELLNIWSLPGGFETGEGRILALFNQIPAVGFWGWISFFQTISQSLTPKEIQEKYLLELPDIIRWENLHRVSGRDPKPTVKTSCSGVGTCPSV